MKKSKTKKGKSVKKRMSPKPKSSEAFKNTWQGVAAGLREKGPIGTGNDYRFVGYLAGRGANVVTGLLAKSKSKTGKRKKPPVS